MEWIEDVVAWVCRYGCVDDPGKEIRKMIAARREYEEPGCSF